MSVTRAAFRRQALSFEGVTEDAHHGDPDFRISGAIFASLAPEPQLMGTIVLNDLDQQRFVDEQAAFSPFPGAWGRRGATRVDLALVQAQMLKRALSAAWRGRASAE